MATITRQQIAGLSTLVREADDVSHEADDAPNDDLALNAVILLHGWGADGANMMDLAPLLAQAAPKTLFFAPDGPAPCSANPTGREWFDLAGTEIQAGPHRARPALEAMIAHIEAEYAIPPSRQVLVGFSQGGMMALHVGLRQTPPLAGVISFSGALLAPERLQAEIAARPPVLLIHGGDDAVVPPQALTIAEAMLKTHDVEVSSILRDGIGHGIDDEGITAAVKFLQRILSASSPPMP